MCYKKNQMRLLVLYCISHFHRVILYILIVIHYLTHARVITYNFTLLFLFLSSSVITQLVQRLFNQYFQEISFPRKNNYIKITDTITICSCLLHRYLFVKIINIIINIIQKFNVYFLTYILFLIVIYIYVYIRCVEKHNT